MSGKRTTDGGIGRMLLGGLFLGMLLVAGGAGPARSQEGNSQASPGASEQGQGLDYAAQRGLAEKAYAEGSFEIARQAYLKAKELDLTPEEERWVAFRIQDTTWRSAASTKDGDDSAIQDARKALEALAPLDTRPEERDRVWAEVQESLGDLSWDREGPQDWNSALPRYQAALGWWGGARDVETARARWLAMFWRITRPSWQERWYGYRTYLGWVPLDLLEQALQVAQEPADVARAHFLLGSYYAQQGRNAAFAGRALRELDAAIEGGRSSDWYDDALYARGQLLENVGRAARDEEGHWEWTPDYVAALASYRRVLSEFEKGETPWWDDAQNRVKAIEQPVVAVQVDRFFLPGSVVAYDLTWRNVASVELTLHRVSLSEDVAFEAGSGLDWLQSLQLEKRAAVRRWTYATGDDGKHVQGTARLVLDGTPEPGAYVLLAQGGGESQRALVLVGDLGVTVKASDGELLAWVTDVESGAPVAGAKVAAWQRWHDGSDWRLRSAQGTTGEDGVALLDVQSSTRWSSWYVAVADGARQAFAAQNGVRSRGEDRVWRIQAQTDRPAYRPGDEVGWRILARERDSGAWSTPAGESLAWEIRDPRGQVVSEGTTELNEFGASWGSFTVPADAALGEFTARFLHGPEKERRQVAQVTLFRLEEYKLPEFEVTVQADRGEGEAAHAPVVGDRLAFDVQATYYWGAPVQDATVQVLVYQRPWQFRWPDDRPYPWLRQDDRRRNWWGGPGQQVLSTTVTTDATGKARVELDTPMDASTDLEYTVQARVTDSSRREVVGGGDVHVTRQEFYARVVLDHQVHEPGRPVELRFETRDPDGKAVGARAHVEVTRQLWREIWVDRDGKEWKGFDRLRLVRTEDGTPLAAGVDPRDAGWAQRWRGYEQEAVTTAVLATDPESGEVRWSFTPPRDGTYRVRWIGNDSRRVPVDAETTLWVCGDRTRELGYEPGGVEVLLDQDTVAPGGEAIAVLSAPESNRWILFTVEGDALFEHRVVHLEGAVKLVHVAVDDRMAPNVWLGATMVAGGRAFQAARELIVPPVAQFLDVSIEPDAKEVVPGAKGTLAITVTDHDGKPVQAELALAVYDRALEAIQQDLVVDPRQFFHGQRQERRVVVGGTFAHGRFVRLRKDDEGHAVEVARNEDGTYHGPADTVPPGGAVRDLQAREGAMFKDASVEAADELGALGYVGGGAQGAVRYAPGAPAAGKSISGPTGGGGGGGTEPAVRVRSDFRKTALWLPSVRTDAEGHARVTVTYPDSTTRWRAVARGADTAVRVGEGEADVRARQPLIARLQAPRFLQADDVVTVSGNLMNGTDADLAVRAKLDLGPGGLALVDGGGQSSEESVVVPANGQTRVDWRVKVPALDALDLRLGPGPPIGLAELVLTAAADSGPSDGMKLTLPTVPRGIEALAATSGRMDGDELTAVVTLPANAERASLRVEATPSLAVTMLDALPYLIDYPYGCVEQTLSRFLPSVVVARTLRDQGLAPEDAMTRVFGGVESRFAGKTHPEGKQALDELDRMTADGLARLYDMQHGDGSWSWWKSGDGDPFMTAYVIWGLSLARDSGLDVRPGVLANGAAWLATELVEAENRPDLAAWELHALGAWGGKLDDERAGYVDAAFARLSKEDRTHLNAYTRALLALACHATGREDEARRLVDNLRNGVKIDDSPDTSIVARDGGQSAPYVLKTAHWGADGVWRRWSEGPVEATATALRALLAIDPGNDLVEPVTAWLVRNRRGAQWSNTRDTAMAVLALNERLRVTGELRSGVGFEVLVNGTSVGTRSLTPAELVGAPAAFTVDPGLLRSGDNQVTLKRTEGDAPLYFSAVARFFDASRPIEARGNELFVRRQYYALVPRETLLKGTVYDRVPLDEGATVESGERIEVVLTLEAKNDLEYLVLEDRKPAGFEAVALQSGAPAYVRRLTAKEARLRFTTDDAEARSLQAGPARDPLVARGPGGPGGPGRTGETRPVHQELRDRLVASFVDRLPEGFWELRYELRAEVPGSFVALPLSGAAMYVPEIRANGRDLAVTVLDRGQAVR